MPACIYFKFKQRSETKLGAMPTLRWIKNVHQNKTGANLEKNMEKKKITGENLKHSKT